LKVDVTNRCPDIPLPSYASEHSSGLDLRAAVGDPVEIPPGERALIPTGIQIALPAGTEGQVRPRSGLALRHGVTVLNAPGTIDADYRGEIQVILVNTGNEAFRIERGMRIAQLVIARVEQCELTVREELAGTARGTDGFGSSGSR
jgi:dUTP pyrophosphatase